MLQSLHVKNLALIEEAEIEFAPGLNIITGETGAGKSMLIGSVNLALGGKFEKDMLGRNAETGLVELTFTSNPKVQQKLLELDIDSEDENQVIISRKLSAQKSTCKINGEMVTAKQVKEVAELLIDIHGQHQHQSLLKPQNHLEILDAFCGEQQLELLTQVKEAYKKYQEMKKALESEQLDEGARLREQSLASYELQEIEEANLIPGEDQQLEDTYRRMVNSKRILEGVSESLQYSGDQENGALNGISRSYRALRGIAGLDKTLEPFLEQLGEIEGLLSDYQRDMEEYMDSLSFQESDYEEVHSRLNTINLLKGKYGRTIEAVLAYGEEKRQQLQKYEDYDAYIAALTKDLQEQKRKLLMLCEKLTEARKKQALSLENLLKNALLHLNFASIEFQIAIDTLKEPAANGIDAVEFLISTNPGEQLKPLHQVASGGELSRIMLAIKTVLAGRDHIDSLIFDEIDTGISGKTAWKVSEQLSLVGQKHQVLCITHLPQIAAMGDAHYVIEKTSQESKTITEIRQLNEQDSLGELARLLGSDELTRESLSNAEKMKQQAKEYKLTHQEL